MSDSKQLLAEIIDLVPCKIDQNSLLAILSKYDIQEKVDLSDKDIKEKMKMFIAAKKLEGLSDLTLKGYRLQLTMFSKVVQKEVERVTTNDIRTFLSDSEGLKISTIATKLSIIKSFFQWLTDEEIILRDPVRKIKAPKKEKRLPKALDIEELEILRESCKSLRERAMVEVMYATGCRLSEIVGMNRKDIDMANASAKVIGKGNKERIVYFNVKALYHLKKYLMTRLDQEEALFVTERKPFRRMGARAIQKAIKKIADRTGIDKNIHPHVMRHTLATLLLNNGADIVAVQHILGHEDPATTQNYAHITEQRKQEAYKKYVVQ